MGIVLAGQLLCVLLDKKSWSKTVFELKAADVAAILLMAVYSIFFINTANTLDFTLPFIYFSAYLFFRIYFQDNSSGSEKIFTRVVPFILSAHYLITILQLLHVFPNFHDFFPAGSTFGNPDKLASYLSVLLPFCFAKSGKKAPDYILLTVGIVLFVILQARTALIAIAVTFVCFLFIEKKISKKVLWICVAACFAGLTALILWHPDSVSGRIFVWIVASCMLLSKPQGYGLYAFQKYFPEAQADYMAVHPGLLSRFNIDEVVYSPFNELLGVGVSIGMIGLALYLLFALFVVRSALRTKTMLLYPVIAFLIVSMSYFPMKIAPIAILMVAFAAMIVSPASSKTILNIKFPAIVGMFVFASISCGLIFINYRTFDRWEKATERSGFSAETTLGNSFHKAYPLLKGNGLFLFSYAEHCFDTGDLQKALCLMEKSEGYHAGIGASHLLAALYEENGETARAEEGLRKAVALSNSQYYPIWVLIMFLDRTGDSAEAYRLAVELYNRPISPANYYADIEIIRIRLKDFIDRYEESPRTD